MRQWSAAVGTAAALYALPLVLFAAVFGRPWAIAVTAACVVVLVYAAIRLWSPLVTLALVVVAAVSVGIWWFVVTAGDACGDSRTAGIVEGVGAIAVALALAAWQLPRGRAVFWALPAGAVLAGIWFDVWAHVIPGGAGACFH